MTPKTVGFSALFNRGFHITFDNGCTVSVQFGPHSYCNEYPHAIRDVRPESQEVWSSPNAEMAAWNSNGQWLRPDDWGDDVKGWVSPAAVLEFMNKVASLERGQNFAEAA